MLLQKQHTRELICVWTMSHKHKQAEFRYIVFTCTDCANNLKQNMAQGACAGSTHQGVNLRLKDVTQTQVCGVYVFCDLLACQVSVAIGNAGLNLCLCDDFSSAD